ncbi:laccase [Penicillium daleae]|uniref:Laccase n=1 Tax=Penicillium daleae TaxID=63821 RepID=A0AAD6CBF2_9EURO|nr:laccase [Penicillium daleae]KAJ5460018.1 laccase [Penicillium daleae]
MRVVYLFLLNFLKASSTCIPPIGPPTIASSAYQESSSLLPTNLEINNTNACTGNTPDNRQQWCDNDIYTDYTTTVPDTGVVREFWFDVTQANLAPDGRSRWTLTINGTIPGPTIIVDWGDTVIVHLRNNLPVSIHNGTSLHFHGIRQLNTNPMDGAVSLTQCPIAPGQSMTYRWRATQYGTTWYHSHMGLQTWEGVFGGIIINGPASANYDEDKGTILLTDWDVRTVDELWDTVQVSGPPTVDNGLINGTNVFGDDGMDQAGRRFKMKFTKGKSYRLRLGNAACDTHFKFSIDHHSLIVIAVDLVPIQPYTTTVLDIAIGQRYDVIVHSNQSALSNAFWLRAIPQLSCSKSLNADNVRGIIYYDEENINSTIIPNSTAHNFTDSCRDEDPSNLIPMVSQPFGLTPSEFFYSETLPVTVSKTNSFYCWQLNGNSFSMNWTQPTLRSLHTLAPSHRPNLLPSFNSCLSAIPLPANSIPVPQPETWVLIIIESTLPIPHPIHLHGHDFILLAQGTGLYTVPTSASLPYATASTIPKRDTALLPAGGHLVLAFHTDNPGVWLLHCHVGWHLEQGFAVQIIEQGEEICRLLNGGPSGEGGAWKEWAEDLEGNCLVWEGLKGGLQGVEDGSAV